MKAKMKIFMVFVFVIFTFIFASLAYCETLANISTEWKMIGSDHSVEVEVVDDPKVQGVSCYITQARTGGIKGSLGIAEDRSNFSVSCRQIGPIVIGNIKEKELVFENSTSIFFKSTQLWRIVDKKRNTLVYVAVSKNSNIAAQGSPSNSASVVPIVTWR